MHALSFVRASSPNIRRHSWYSTTHGCRRASHVRRHVKPWRSTPATATATLAGVARPEGLCCEESAARGAGGCCPPSTGGAAPGPAAGTITQLPIGELPQSGTGAPNRPSADMAPRLESRLKLVCARQHISAARCHVRGDGEKQQAYLQAGCRESGRQAAGAATTMVWWATPRPRSSTKPRPRTPEKSTGGSSMCSLTECTAGCTTHERIQLASPVTVSSFVRSRSGLAGLHVAGGKSHLLHAAATSARLLARDSWR